MAQSVTSSSIVSADGVSDPTLALNTAPVNYWATSEPFIDIWKQSGEFRTDGWGRVDQNLLDDNGWPTRIPNGTSKVTQIFDFQMNTDAPGVSAGSFVLSYEGEGQIQIRGDVSNIQYRDGEVTFDFAGEGRILVDFVTTDPRNTGDYIRDVSLVREEYVELHEAGAIFNPDYIDVIEDTAQLRFMDWAETNNSHKKHWWQEPSFEDASWSTNGVPVEVQVELANQTGADPWFTMPHGATDEYVRKFAAYVRDNLDPDLVATVEYSNEAWNTAFEQNQWMSNQAKSLYNDNSAGAPDYYAQRATEVALIWDEQFGDEADTRVVNTIGSHGVNPWLTQRILNAEQWKENDPDGFVDPKSVFDAVAITTYFGNGVVTNDGSRSALINAIRDPNVDANRYLYNQLSNPNTRTSTEANMDAWTRQSEIAEENGMSLIAYEGGQHVHHSFATNIPQRDLDILTDFMADFARSEEMARLYEENWDAWKSISDGPYMQFQGVNEPGRWGSWGLQASLNDSTPRSEYAYERSATEGQWWEDDRSGDQALQGRTILGDNRDETFIGTVEEDFLIGAGGDDILVGGRGDDGLHGGDGTDTVVLAGMPDDYSIKSEDDGYRIDGIDGSDFVLEVEKFLFDDGPELTLAEFLNYVPGSLSRAPQEPETPETQEPEVVVAPEPSAPQEPPASAEAEEEDPVEPVVEPVVEETPEPVEETSSDPVVEESTEPAEEETEQQPETASAPENKQTQPEEQPAPPAPEPEPEAVQEETPEEAPQEPVEQRAEPEILVETTATDPEEEEESGITAFFDRLFSIFSNLFGGGDDDEEETAAEPQTTLVSEAGGTGTEGLVLLGDVIPTTDPVEEEQTAQDDTEEDLLLVA